MSSSPPSAASVSSDSLPLLTLAERSLQAEGASSPSKGASARARPESRQRTLRSEVRKADPRATSAASPTARASPPSRAGPSSSKARHRPSRAYPLPFQDDSSSSTSSPAGPNLTSSDADSQQSTAKKQPPMSKIIAPLPTTNPDPGNIARIRALKTDLNSKIQSLLPCITEWDDEERHARDLFHMAAPEWKEFHAQEWEASKQYRVRFLAKMEKLQRLGQRLDEVLGLESRPRLFRERMLGIIKDLRAYG